VFALSDFERVAYTLEGDGQQPTLNLHLMEKSWGPNILRFDLGFHIGTDANTAFMIGGDYLRTWLNARRRSARLVAIRPHVRPRSVAVPATRCGQRWFVEPGALAQRSIEDIFIDGESVARYRVLARLGLARRGPRVRQPHGTARRASRGGGQIGRTRDRRRRTCRRSPARATAA
jgi:NTE family protein